MPRIPHTDDDRSRHGCVDGEGRLRGGYDRRIEGIRYSFVIPVFNERETLTELWAQLSPVVDALDGPAEVIFVDDCSTDGSGELLVALQRNDPRVRLLRLARNFGHQIAITAGLDFAVGEAVIVMDADLQDPPDLVPELVARWREGYEVVYAVRERREGESWFKRATAGVFYRVMQRLSSVEIPVDVGDFRLVDRRALDTFRSMRERNRYVRGMFSWIGFRQTGVPYSRSKRFAGRPKYSFRRSLRLGVDGMVSFSNLPLRAALVLGFVVSGMSFVIGIAAIVAKLAGAFVVPGWASLIVVASFLGGIQLTVLGVMGLYVARIYDEVKSRPLYIVREAHGLMPGASIAPDESSRAVVRDLIS